MQRKEVVVKYRNDAQGLAEYFSECEAVTVQKHLINIKILRGIQKCMVIFNSPKVME